MSDENITPGPGSEKSPKGRRFSSSFIWKLLIIVVVLVGIISSIYMVDQTEQAVVLTFGKYTTTVGAGLKYKIPFGIQTVYKVKTQVLQTMQFGFRTAQAGVQTTFASGDYSNESIMLTGDLNIVDVQWVIQYYIIDPEAWLFNVYENEREKTIRDISQAVINQLVGDRGIMEILGSERENIQEAALPLMQELVDKYGLGISLNKVRLQNIVPPVGSVQDAFEDVNKAIQDMNRLINEGKEAYNAQIPKAKGEAEQKIRVAEGYKAERINEALGDVARFKAVLDEYKKSPSVTRSRLYYEMLDEVLTNTTDVELIDKNLINTIPLKILGTGGNQ